MTTTPTDTAISGTLSHDLNFLRHHLILLGLVVVLVAGSVYGILTIIARHDHENFLEKQAFAQTLLQQNQQFQQQTKAQMDALAQSNTILQQEVGTLASAIASRDAQLRTQQAKVPELTPDQLSLEWQKDIKNAGNIKPVLPSGYSVDQAAAVATVQALESEITLELDKADLQKSNANLQSQLANEDAILVMERKSHLSDNQTNQAALAAKDAEIKDVKAQARKSKLKYLGIGYVLGLISGRVLGI